MKNLKKYTASLLLLVLSFYIVPKEFFHLLHSHTETVDSYFAKDSNAQLSEEHVHCATLQLSAPSYYLLLRQFSFKTAFIRCITFTCKEISAHTFSPSPFFQRGPPAAALLS